MTQVTNPATQVGAEHGYAHLARSIREAGLMERRYRWYAVLTLVLLATTAAVVTAMVLARGSWWLIALAPVLAVTTTQTGFLGHDVGHRQVTRGSRPSRALGLVAGNLLTGLSYAWWVEKHNAHHAHPNDLERDPDVRAGAIVWSAEQATARRGAAAWWTSHQAALFVPLLLLEALNLHVSSLVALARGGLRARGAETALLLTHLGAYATLLVLTLDGWQILVFAAVHKGLQGLYLGLSFAPGHKGMPLLSREDDVDPLRRQVLTSRTMRGGPVTDLLLGGLNYQVEHHLFPGLPRPHLRAAQRIVSAHCRERDIAYLECSAWSSYRTAFTHMAAVGAATQPHRARGSARALPVRPPRSSR